MSGLPAARRRSGRARRVVAAMIVLAAAVPFVMPALRALKSPPGQRPTGAPNLNRMQAEALSELPLSFEANVGQAVSGISYLARGQGYDAYLGPSYATLAAGSGTDRSQVHISFVGGSERPQLAALDQQTGRANYFAGKDPDQWRTGIEMFSRVAYQQIYPGIDVVYHGTRQALEYDFVLQPGANPDDVVLEFGGAGKVSVDDIGDLVVGMAGATFRQHRPNAFQDLPEGRRTVDAGYVVADDGTVRLRLAHYDPTRALVIDPVIEASTYYGGKKAIDYPGGMRVDTAGNVYLSGEAFANDFPTTANAVYPSLGGAFQATVVVKMNPDLSAVFYATYLMDGDIATQATGSALAVDADGSAYVAGNVAVGPSRDFLFPTTPNPIYDCTWGGAFLVRLSPGGDRLLYSTCVDDPSVPHSAHNDTIRAIAVAAPGKVWIVGETLSPGFPTTPGADRTLGGDGDGFLAQIDTSTPGGKALVFSTFVGGGGYDSLNSVAIDVGGNVYASGYTVSMGSFLVPCPHATQQDGILLKFNAGGALQYAKCGPLGGSSAHLALDGTGNLYVIGSASPDFGPMVTDNAYRKAPAGLSMAKIDPTGSRVIYATYLPGSEPPEISHFSGASVAVDDNGHVYIAGTTGDSTFVTKNAPIRTAIGGAYDGFVAEIDTNKAGEDSLIFATLLGGSERDGFGQIAIGPTGDLYVFGGTLSKDVFPPPGPTGVQKQANNDWIVARISPPPTLASVSVSGGPACGGTSVQLVGARLQGTTKVRFGDRDASDVRQIDATHVDVVAPPRPPGVVEVTLTARSGDVAFPYSYRAVPTPTVSNVSPDRGPVEGGTSVVVSGTDLTCVRDARFGDTTSAVDLLPGGGSLRIVAPAHARGPVEVVLSADAGDGSRILSVPGATSQFTYLAIPVISALLPDCGPPAGGTQLAIQGRNLSGATGVTFGTTTVGAVSDANPTRLAAISPSLADGDVQVTVTTPDGTSAPGPANFRVPCAAPVGTGSSGPANNPVAKGDNSGSQNLATPGGSGTPGANANPGPTGANIAGPGGGSGGTPAGAGTPGGGGGGGGGSPIGVGSAGSGGGTGSGNPVGAGGTGGSSGGGGGGGGSPVAASTPGGGTGGGGSAAATTPGAGGGGSGGQAGAGVPGGGGGNTPGASPVAAGRPGGDVQEAPRYAMVDQRNDEPSGRIGLRLAGATLLVLFACSCSAVVGHGRKAQWHVPAWAQARS